MKPILSAQHVPDGSARAVLIPPTERAVRIDGETRQIGARVFDVLAYLDAHSGRVVTKAELLEHVWADLNVEESNLTVQIATLRKLIGARAIATVPGVGFQLTLAAEAPAEPPKALPLPDTPSLAVLPFANLTGDAGKDYLVRGIVADLIATLSSTRPDPQRSGRRPAAVWPGRGKCGGAGTVPARGARINQKLVGPCNWVLGAGRTKQGGFGQELLAR